MKRVYLSSAFLCLFAFFSSVEAKTFNTRQFNWNGFQDDFTFKKDSFSGDWKKSDTWDGLLCDGKYDGVATINGAVKGIDFKLNEDQSLNVNADLRSIVIGLKGDYQSDLSACATITLSHSITIDFVDITAHATFKDNGDGKNPDLKIEVLSTILGKVDYSDWLPGWFQDYLTDSINAGLAAVWSSSLGKRIDAFISAQLAKQIPHRSSIGSGL